MKNLAIICLCLLGANWSFGQNHYCTDYTPEEFFALDVARQLIEEDAFDPALLNAAMFHTTNLERAKHNLPPFQYHAGLERAAQGHSADMVAHDFYSHTSPVLGKERMGDRLELEGVAGGYRAENIFKKNHSRPATYASFAKATVQGWMDSIGHRRNILNNRLQFLGCGAAYYPDKEWPQYIWVMCTQTFSSAEK